MTLSAGTFLAGRQGHECAAGGGWTVKELTPDHEDEVGARRNAQAGRLGVVRRTRQMPSSRLPGKEA